MPQVSASASEKNGIVTVTLANISADAPAEIEIQGVCAKSAKGRLLTGEIHALNDFDASPLEAQELPLTLEKGGLRVSLPACAVAEITLTC